MTDERNDYGFPVIQDLVTQILGFDLFGGSAYNAPTPQQPKFERAKQYAAEVRERNKPACQCDACKQTEMLPAVLGILASRRKRNG